MLRGTQGFSFSSPSRWKRVAKEDCSLVCGLRAEVVEADVRIRPLNVVLADESSMATFSGEEKALLVVGEASLVERDNLMRWHEEWKSSCLA